MSQTIVIVGPNLQDKDGYTFHVHNADCADKKRQIYRHHRDDWEAPFEVDSIQEIVETAYADQISEAQAEDSEVDWTLYEGEFNIFGCVDADELEYQAGEVTDEEGFVDVAPVVKPVVKAAPKAEVKPAVVEEDLSDEPRYAVSGVVTMAQLIKLTDSGKLDNPLEVLAANGLKVRLSNQKVYVPKRKPGQFKSVKNVDAPLELVNATETTKVPVVLTGVVASLLGVQGGVSSARGRGTQYKVILTGEQLLETAKSAKALALQLRSQKTRTQEEWANLSALDKALGDLLPLL